MQQYIDVWLSNPEPATFPVVGRHQCIRISILAIKRPIQMNGRSSCSITLPSNVLFKINIPLTAFEMYHMLVELFFQLYVTMINIVIDPYLHKYESLFIYIPKYDNWLLYYSPYHSLILFI